MEDVVSEEMSIEFVASWTDSSRLKKSSSVLYSKLRPSAILQETMVAIFILSLDNSHLWTTRSQNWRWENRQRGERYEVPCTCCYLRVFVPGRPPWRASLRILTSTIRPAEVASIYTTPTRLWCKWPGCQFGSCVIVRSIEKVRQRSNLKRKEPNGERKQHVWQLSCCYRSRFFSLDKRQLFELQRNGIRMLSASVHVVVMVIIITHFGRRRVSQQKAIRGKDGETNFWG